MAEMNSAVLVAAGKGTRIGPGVDKLFLEVAGRPVIAHTWQRFNDAKCIEEIVIVAIVCIIFLLHARSAFVAIFTLPTAILISFVVMKMQGINANIMSLGGIAIAVSAT